MKRVENFDLTPCNSYKVQSYCKRAFFPENASDFISIYRDPEQNKTIILGGGYNIILSQQYYDYDFVIIGESFSRIEQTDENILICEAGVSTKKLCEFALSKCLSGVEVFYDIPSSIGGAVVMNAGASGEEIKDILLKVQYLDLDDLLIKEISRDEINYEYRNSFFQKNPNKIVLKAWLQLQEHDPDFISNKMQEIKEARFAKQPKDFPNAGSVFKRPKGYYVGPMIDQLGLKGFSVGGAKISEKHGGFIINFNDATGGDIIELIGIVQKKVKDTFAVDLEIEQRII